MDANDKKHMFQIKHIGDLSANEGYHVWHPATDLFETNDQFIVKIEISGMQNEDFSINFDKSTLSINGSRAGNNIAGCYHRMEIPNGEFSSTINIPGDILIMSIEAYYENGFLTIILPKKEPVRVEISED
ncbi:MAG: Hsp20/alpha crystallin family protein [Pelolinea sp.]|nr:Hsp20/alpha crystallin family protein [Pelolinea sp.]